MRKIGRTSASGSLLGSLVISLLLFTTALAQAGRSTVQGTLKDPAGKCHLRGDCDAHQCGKEFQSHTDYQSGG